MKRLVDDWMLLVGVLIGFVIATTLAAGTPLYLNSLDRLAFDGGLDSLSSPVLDVTIFASHISLTTRSIERAEQAISEAVASFTGTSEVAYAIGDWVQIDNGTRTVDVKTKHLGQAQFGEMFGDFQDDLQWDLETQEDYSSGFVCDTGPSKGHITVYNFKHNREQTIDVAFVRPVSPGLRAAFNGDTVLSAIRDLRLGLDERGLDERGGPRRAGPR